MLLTIQNKTSTLVKKKEKKKLEEVFHAIKNKFLI